MSRSFFLAGILGVIAVSGAHASGLALKKVDSMSRRAAVILPGSLLKAQSFRFPAELGAAPAPKADTKAVPVGMKPKFERKERIQTKIAVVQPVLGPYLRNNQSWQQATAHVQDPRFNYIEPIDQDALKTEYTARQSELDVMLPQADSLDTQDDQLVGRKQDLDSTYANLQQEIANYNGQVNSHNAQCNPAPDDPTYQWCLQDGARLDAWKTAIQTEIDNYTAAANQYNADFDAFKGNWDAFVQNISSWEARVKALIQKIEAAFAASLGTCTEARRKELQDDVTAKCKVVSRACKGDQECEMLRQNLAKNQACYDARKKIVDECFGGKPSPGHQQELNEAQNAINTCITWIGKICGAGIRSEAR